MLLDTLVIKVLLFEHFFIQFFDIMLLLDNLKLFLVQFVFEGFAQLLNFIKFSSLPIDVFLEVEVFYSFAFNG